MIQWLVKKYAKSDDPALPATREAYGIVCSLISIVCNGLMMSFKLGVGIVTHSVAIQADAFNNLSDMGSNLATLFGFKMAGKHPDPQHPYGHGRYEYITGLIISFLILLVGLTSLKDSLLKIWHPDIVVFKGIAVFVLVVSMMIKFWMYFVNHKAAIIIDSSSLNAAAQDSLNDVFMTMATFISLCVSVFSDFPIDGWIGFVVSIFVLKSGVEIFQDTVSPLLGQAPDKDLVDSIYEYVLSFDKVIGIHDFMMHDYGPSRRYITFHAEVDSHEDLMEVHDQIDYIERHLLERYHILTTIHMDPVVRDDPLTEQLKEMVTNVVKDLNEEYSIHDFRIVSGPTHTNLIFDVLIPFQDEIAHQELRKMIQEKVSHIQDNYYCIIQIDHSMVL